MSEWERWVAPQNPTPIARLWVALHEGSGWPCTEEELTARTAELYRNSMPYTPARGAKALEKALALGWVIRTEQGISPYYIRFDGDNDASAYDEDAKNVYAPPGSRRRLALEAWLRGPLTPSLLHERVSSCGPDPAWGRRESSGYWVLFAQDYPEGVDGSWLAPPPADEFERVITMRRHLTPTPPKGTRLWKLWSWLLEHPLGQTPYEVNTRFVETWGWDPSHTRANLRAGLDSGYLVEDHGMIRALEERAPLTVEQRLEIASKPISLLSQQGGLSVAALRAKRIEQARTTPPPCAGRADWDVGPPPHPKTSPAALDWLEAVVDRFAACQACPLLDLCRQVPEYGSLISGGRWHGPKPSPHPKAFGSKVIDEILSNYPPAQRQALRTALLCIPNSRKAA